MPSKKRQALLKARHPNYVTKEEIESDLTAMLADGQIEVAGMQPCDCGCGKMVPTYRLTAKGKSLDV